MRQKSRNIPFDHARWLSPRREAVRAYSAAEAVLAGVGGGQQAASRMERKGHGLRSWMHVLVPAVGCTRHISRGCRTLQVYGCCSNRNLKPETMKSSMHTGEWRRNGQEAKKYYFLVIGAPASHKKIYSQNEYRTSHNRNPCCKIVVNFAQNNPKL